MDFYCDEILSGRVRVRRIVETEQVLATAHHCTKLMLLSNAKRHGAHASFRRCGFVNDTKQAFVKYRRQFGNE
jgi:hypothetical protein